MSALTEAALLREVARVQRDKTLQDVRDLLEAIKMSKPSSRNSYSSDDRSAREFKADLVAGLKALRDQP